MRNYTSDLRTAVIFTGFTYEMLTFYLLHMNYNVSSFKIFTITMYLYKYNDLYTLEDTLVKENNKSCFTALMLDQRNILPY